jgi:hypothetical protein
MMEERMTSGAFPESNPTAGSGPAPGARGGPGHLADPRALQILATEHWSLLAGRSLSYNEAFSRAGMFLSFLAASLVALALIAQVTGISTDLAWIAAIILAVDLFIGLATLGRISNASGEEMNCVRGMNRIRHAYLEIAPGLEPYFVAPWHDDLAGILRIYSTGRPEPSGVIAGILHGLTTTPGMIGVIDAVIGGGLAATVAIGLGLSGLGPLVVGIVVAILIFLAISAVSVRGVLSMEAVPARFPSPSGPDDPPRAGLFG